MFADPSSSIRKYVIEGESRRGRTMRRDRLNKKVYFESSSLFPRDDFEKLTSINQLLCEGQKQLKKELSLDPDGYRSKGIELDHLEFEKVEFYFRS